MKVKKHVRDRERLAKIIKMYYEQKMSMRAIASVFHVTKQAIWSLLRQEGLKNRPLLSEEEVQKEYQKYISDSEYTHKEHPYSLSTYLRYFKEKGLALRHALKPQYTKEFTEGLHKKYMNGDLSLIRFCREHNTSVGSLSSAFKKWGFKAKKPRWEGYWERVRAVEGFTGHSPSK